MSLAYGSQNDLKKNYAYFKIQIATFWLHLIKKTGNTGQNQTFIKVHKF